MRRGSCAPEVGGVNGAGRGRGSHTLAVRGEWAVWRRGSHAPEVRGAGWGRGSCAPVRGCLGQGGGALAMLRAGSHPRVLLPAPAAAAPAALPASGGRGQLLRVTSVGAAGAGVGAELGAEPGWVELPPRPLGGWPRLRHPPRCSSAPHSLGTTKLVKGAKLAIPFPPLPIINGRRGLILGQVEHTQLKVRQQALGGAAVTSAW